MRYLYFTIFAFGLFATICTHANIEENYVCNLKIAPRGDTIKMISLKSGYAPQCLQNDSSGNCLKKVKANHSYLVVKGLTGGEHRIELQSIPGEASFTGINQNEGSSRLQTVTFNRKEKELVVADFINQKQTKEADSQVVSATEEGPKSYSCSRQ